MTRHQSETERRSQILGAARAVFIERGYDGTRVEDVAKRARLSKGAVYFYFASKRDLFLALAMEEHDTTWHFLKEAEAREISALHKLIQVGSAYLSYLAGLDSPPRFFLMMTEMASRDAELQEECSALHQVFVDAVTRILAQGMAEGTFRPMDPVAVSEMLKATIDGFGGQAAIGIAPDPARLLTEGFRTVLRGILQQPDEADVLLQRLQAQEPAAASPSL